MVTERPVLRCAEPAEVSEAEPSRSALLLPLEDAKSPFNRKLIANQQLDEEIYCI